MHLNPQKITRIRKMKRYKISAVAACLGIEPTHLGCIELGRRPVSTDSDIAKGLMAIYDVKEKDMI